MVRADSRNPNGWIAESIAITGLESPVASAYT